MNQCELAGACSGSSIELLPEGVAHIRCSIAVPEAAAATQQLAHGGQQNLDLGHVACEERNAFTFILNSGGIRSTHCWTMDWAGMA